MTHIKVYEAFKALFPTYAESVTNFYSNGKNSIRLRVGEAHRDVIFTYNSDKDWRFETVDSFLNK